MHYRLYLKIPRITIGQSKRLSFFFKTLTLKTISKDIKRFFRLTYIKMKLLINHELSTIKVNLTRLFQ